MEESHHPLRRLLRQPWARCWRVDFAKTVALVEVLSRSEFGHRNNDEGDDDDDYDDDEVHARAA